MSNDDPSDAGEPSWDEGADEEEEEEEEEEQCLDPHKAREIIRLFQCAECSRPLKLPVRLPCGNTICQKCLPPFHKRNNITYPMIVGREEGFYCPFISEKASQLGSKECHFEHVAEECSIDVVLNKVAEDFKHCLYSGSLDLMKPELDVLLSVKGADGIGQEGQSDLQLQVSGGNLIGTYLVTLQGKLPYTADVLYASARNDTAISKVDRDLFKAVKKRLRVELDCQVCYSLVLDPLTTPCGHTFCRTCVSRVLNHSNLCPTCRRKLPMVTLIENDPGNITLSRLIESFFPAELTSRVEASKFSEDSIINGKEWIPLFVCTLSFPLMPTYLHVFEPRYRLMIRRALQNGDRKFGMVSPNRTHSRQGELGVSSFMQYGTLLVIDRFEMLPDGRSFIRTVGVSRFKVLEYNVVDGYYVGKVERVNDVSISEEENIEARETGNNAIQPVETSGESSSSMEHLSTQALFQTGLDFVAKSRDANASWLRERVLAAYGEPPTDAAVFPYWFASVSPIPEIDRYALLSITSVRERLKVTAQWARDLKIAER